MFRRRWWYHATTSAFKINDGDALLCQRDLSDSYQVTIMPNTRLDLEAQQLNIAADLSHFPRPFLDEMQMTPTTLTFAFPAKTLPEQVGAAALIASWLGIEADYRGIAFDALHDQLPEKNGILFGKPGESIGGLTLPASNGATLQVVDNPANPIYKLLLVVGNNEQQLKSAAWRLTRGQFTAQTTSLPVEAQNIPVSKPYDAPRWISTDRPVLLSELMRKDQSLTVTGIWHEPLTLAFRAAPDLFMWDGDTIPLKVGYRFPTESWIDEQRSYLSMTFNGAFLRNLPVNKQGLLESLWHKLGGDARQENVEVPLEPYLIYGDNQLQLYFNIQTKEAAPCSVLLNNNIKSRIDEDSSIDLSKIAPLYAAAESLLFRRRLVPVHPSGRLLADGAAAAGEPERKRDQHAAGSLCPLRERTGTALNNNRVMFGLPSGGANLLRLSQSDVLAVSSLDELANGTFLPAIGEIDDLDPQGVKRVVMCSGKVYYDLLEQRRKNDQKDVAIVRIEQLYPFPHQAMQEALKPYAHVHDFVWCQEEPLNQGAWYCSQHHFREVIPFGSALRYAGRPASASPAVGYMSVHQKQQQDLVNDALNVD